MFSTCVGFQRCRQTVGLLAESSLMDVREKKLLHAHSHANIFCPQRLLSLGCPGMPSLAAAHSILP